MDQPIKLEVTEMRSPGGPSEESPSLPVAGLHQSPNGALPVQMTQPAHMNGLIPPTSSPQPPPSSYHHAADMAMNAMYGHPVPPDIMRAPMSTLSNASTRFPVKLWEIVTTDQSGSICWNPEGNGFIVDHERFEQYYLKAGTFKTTKITSFVRQLNLYGFRKAKKNHLSPETWETYMSGAYSRKQSERVKKSRVGVLREYRHTHFLRDKPDYLTYVRRVSDSSRKSAEDKGIRKPKPQYRRSIPPMGLSMGAGCHTSGYASMIMAPPGFPEYDWFQAGSSGAPNVSELFGMTSQSVHHNMSHMGSLYGASYSDPNAFWHQLPGYSAWFNGSAAQQMAGAAEAASSAASTSGHSSCQVEDGPAPLPGFAELHPSVNGHACAQPSTLATDPAYVSPGTSFATENPLHARMGEYVVSYWDQGAPGPSPSDPPTDLTGSGEGHAITTEITNDEQSVDGTAPMGGEEGSKSSSGHGTAGTQPPSGGEVENPKGAETHESAGSATYFSL